jgi:cell wall-associated NlpC family hydrolase
MRRICALAIGLAMLVGTPGLASADSWQGTRQQAISYVITRALSQRGVPYAYGGGNVSGPSLGTTQSSTPAAPAGPGAPAGLGVPADPAASTVGVIDLSSTVAPPATTVGFDASGLVVYAFGGVGIKMPRSSGEQYKVGRKVLPAQALPGDLIFYGPEGTQSVALFIGNGQMVEATDPAVTVSPVRTTNMTPYLTRIIES